MKYPKLRYLFLKVDRGDPKLRRLFLKVDRGVLLKYLQPMVSLFAGQKLAKYIVQGSIRVGCIITRIPIGYLCVEDPALRRIVLQKQQLGNKDLPRSLPRGR